jgi:allantoicase
MDFLDLPDLAARAWGGAVLYANDDFFAEKDNLLKPEPAVFLDGKYTDRGKWMDGWESRRKRVAGHDFAIVRLGLPGAVAGVVVDTAFFKGNFPKACSIDGVNLPGQPTVDDLLREDVPWVPVLAQSDLKGDSKNLFEVLAAARGMRFTHLRLNIFPDGGVARLRVHGTVIASPRWLGRVTPHHPEVSAEVDLGALEHGARVVACNDMFFGSRHNLLGPGRGVNMGDGWETKRSRKLEADWAIIELAARGTIHRALIDTLHFKGNFPESAGLDIADLGFHADVASLPESAWTPFLSRTKLQAHTLHDYEAEILPHPPGTHVRLRIWPDGGVSRLKLIGTPTAEARTGVVLRYLNALPLRARVAVLREACHSTRYAEKLASAAPYGSAGELLAASSRAFDDLTQADWDEAFAGHPRIGEKKPDAVAMSEQAKVVQGSDATRAALAEVNATYEAKFGHIYLVFASGRSAEELLAIAQTRLQNDAATEMSNAKAEQRKITELRLAKLLRTA